MRQGERALMLHSRLDRDTWLERRRSDITITGLDACRDMFCLVSCMEDSSQGGI